MSEELREKLAAIEHERWADWQKWVNYKVVYAYACDACNDEASIFRVPVEDMNRWNKQIATPYAELAEWEKRSDREQVDRYWPLIEAAIAQAKARAVEAASKVDENTSDGYHTFNELYKFRLLYNAALFNEWAEMYHNPYDVHKSHKHSDGEDCFGGGWFVVVAELLTGQITNHYENKDWDLFNIPVRTRANAWDGHTPQDVAKRLRAQLRASKERE